MELWHFLSRPRLQEKIEFAQVNDGNLLLHRPTSVKDISKGAILEYIYCLPLITSGMNFGDQSEVSAIRIELKPDAKVMSFRGNPKSIDFDDVRRKYDAIDMVVDSLEFSNIRFRQILLMKQEAVRNWPHSEISDFKSLFSQGISDHAAGRFHQEDFFMIDFQPRERSAAMKLMGHQLGFEQLEKIALEAEYDILNEALKRLHALE